MAVLHRYNNWMILYIKTVPILVNQLNPYSFTYQWHWTNFKWLRLYFVHRHVTMSYTMLRTHMHTPTLYNVETTCNRFIKVSSNLLLILGYEENQTHSMPRSISGMPESIWLDNMSSDFLNLDCMALRFSGRLNMLSPSLDLWKIM